jgi:2'-5' RNA ligase
MRLFIALDIEAAIAGQLDAYVRALRPRVAGVRFVRTDNFHVTLKFLGEVRDAASVEAALAAVQAPQVELSVRGVGFFPSARAPRVFWAGVESQQIVGLAAQIEERMAALGFVRERDFHPHLTLARNGSGRPRPLRGERPPEAFAQLAALVANSAVPEFGTMTARQFYLYESRLLPSGAEYRKLAAFALDGPEPALDQR